MNELPILKIARRLRDRSGVRWLPPRETSTMGPGSWYIDEDLPTDYRRIIVTYGPHAEALLEHAQRHGVDTISDPPEESFWVHASISRRNEMPTYADLVLMHHAVWADNGWAYQVFAPRSAHVNIHEYALHLWGRLDGRAELPNFGLLGTI